MAQITKEYIQSIIPEGLPDGRNILEEGKKLGRSINTGKTKFLKDKGYDTYMEYWKARIHENKISYSTNIGLATLKEQLEGIKELKEWCDKNNVNFHLPLCIPSINLAIPRELRNDAADATSYMLDTVDDYIAHEQIDGVTCMQVNQTLFVPNALETTINTVKAGSPFTGVAAQLSWDFPGCTDHVNYLIDILKSLGIMAEKRKDGLMIASYQEDGLGGNVVDIVSLIGLMMLENYIYQDLCGVAICQSFGGLISDIRYKAALLKVVDKIFTQEDHPGVLLQHASTTSQWDHDLQTNFGSSCQEIMMMILAERHYKTGASLTTVPITEKVCVPTLENIETIMGAASRMEETAWQWEEMIDFSSIDRLADDMYEKGKAFFDNFMETMEKSGVDTEDPLQMMSIIKFINGALLEESFHPSVKEMGKFVPYYPNDMGKLVLEMTEEKIKALKKEGYEGSMRGKRVLVGSLDCHLYGIRYVQNVLTAMGAEVILGGVDHTCHSILDLADESGIDIVGVSTHNGQSLGLAKQLASEMKKRDRDYTVFMGGVLNTILPGHSEPTEVTQLIRNEGIFAANDLKDTIDLLNNH